MSDSTATLDPATIDPTPAVTAPPGQLSEESLRSPGFRGGEPIQLSDGQEWFFPIPKVEIRPKLSAGKITGTVVQSDLGDDFNLAMDELDGDVDTGNSFIAKMFQVAIAMLRVNYDLDDETICKLLVFKVDDESNGDTWKAIMGLARGESDAPKGRGTDTQEPSS